MKNSLLIVLIIIISILASLLTSLSLGSGDIKDYIIVKTIPQYPNASKWEANVSSGFPYGSPDGEIIFQTNDEATQVFDFYKKELGGRGWSIDDSPFTDNTANTAGSKFGLKKEIGGYTFQIYMSKTDMTKEQKVEYMNTEFCQKYPGGCSDVERVLMFIEHNKK